MLLPFLTPFLLLAPVLSSGLLVGLLLCQLIPLHFGSPDLLHAEYWGYKGCRCGLQSQETQSAVQRTDLEPPLIGKHAMREVCRQKCFRLRGDQACLDSTEDPDEEVVTPELGFEE